LLSDDTDMNIRRFMH